MALSIRLKYTGMKLLESEAKNSRSNASFEVSYVKAALSAVRRLRQNEGYRASLEKRKIYVALRDPVAEKRGQLRVIDESGEDYLYPKAFFRSIALPQSIRKAVLAAA
jgi:hypothetical protein